jgi:rRNA small subunit pseudouridine methyltransferase Nep1
LGISIGKYFYFFGFTLVRGFQTLFTVVIAESGLEPIPKQLWKHRLIRKYVQKRGKDPRFLLLDRSYHHAAMKTLEEAERRGRPDIVHFSLLEALGSPLCKEGLLQVYTHTIADSMISVNKETRLPRNYNRFLGLMEQLLELKHIPSEGSPLLTLTEDVTLPRLIEKTKPDYVVTFSRKGTAKTLEKTVSEFVKKKNPVAIIGGFPHGTLSETTTKLADDVVSIDREMLEAWTVVARIIYEYERQIGLPLRRLAHG